MPRSLKCLSASKDIDPVRGANAPARNAHSEHVKRHGKYSTDHDDTMKAALPAIRYDSINDGGPTVIGAFRACECGLYSLQVAEPGEFQELK